MRRLLAALTIVAMPCALASEPPLLRDFIGINGHTVQFRPALYRPVASHVRDYHPVAWDLGGDSSTLPKFPTAKNGVDWSAVYGSWFREGWHIDVSLMFESVPRDAWKDVARNAHDYGKAFAQMFGPGGQHPFVSSAEVGNEPGKWSDADFEIMARGMAAGLREGDPKLKIVTCNLTTGKSGGYDKSVSCLDGMLDLFDVLAIHSYPLVEGWPTWRRSFPEDPALKDYLPSIERLCKWRDSHAPAKPVWITEFGYDASTKPPPAEGTFSKWQDVTDTQQAQWLVRSLLVFSAMPVERAYIYFFNDSDEPQFHGSSGLTRNFEPKPAFYAVQHLQKALGDFRFERIVADRAGELRIQEYRSPSGGIAWAVWSPTGSNRSVPAQLPPFPGKLEHAERMPLDADPSANVRIPQDRKVAVTESPLYLFFAPGVHSAAAN